MDMKPENILKALEAGKAAFDASYDSKRSISQNIAADSDALNEGLARARAALFEGVQKVAKKVVHAVPNDKTVHAIVPTPSTAQSGVHEQILASRGDPDLVVDVLRNAREGMPGGAIARELQQDYLKAFEGDLAKSEPAFAAAVARAR